MRIQGLLSEHPLSSTQRRIIWGVIGVLIVVTLFALPFESIRLPSSPGIVQVTTTISILAEGLTCYLLTVQYRLVPHITSLILLLTYAASGTFAFFDLLAFPGVFAPTGLFHASTQTVPWLYVWWHISFSAGLVGYVYFRHHPIPATQRRHIVRLALGISAGIVLCGILMSFMLGERWPIVQKQAQDLIITNGVIVFCLLSIEASAVIVVLRYLPGNSSLNAWLRVGIVASALDALLVSLGGTRYHLTWYVARFEYAVAACTLLGALLQQVMLLYYHIVKQNTYLQRLNRQIAEDANKLQQAQRARQQAETQATIARATTERMDEFFSLASHELRTPLTSIVGYQQILERRLKRIYPEEWAEQQPLLLDLLQSAYNNAHLLDRLIGDLLDVARFKAQPFALICLPVDLQALVEETIATLQITIPQRQIQFMAPIHVLPLVMLDSQRIQQVLSNLLGNAIKHTQGDTPIVVRLSSDDAYAQIEVQDSGPGIPPDALPLIWNRFYRVPGGSHTNGLGVGLYLCKMIIEAHQGQIAVKSVQGQGATFWFTLPLFPAVPTVPDT